MRAPAGCRTRGVVGWPRAAASAEVPPALREKQERLLQRRVRGIARVVATLTVAWLPIDALGLSGGEFLRVMPLRLGLAAALLWLAWTAASRPANTLVRLLLGLQVLGYGLLLLALDVRTGSLLHLGYGLFPFVVTSQLALLPLRWTRAAALASLPAWLLVLAPIRQGLGIDAVFWNDVWLYLLISAMACWAAHAQLRLLVELLGAREDSLRDALTGLGNRRHADRRLAAELARARRTGAPLSVALLDIDHFKRVNDEHGHAIGDRVLAATGATLAARVRASDTAARYGGEEFLLVMPDTDAQRALEVVERIRASVAVQAGAPGPGPVPDAPLPEVRLSAGIATLHTDETLTALLARADAALYRAKAAGRDRCVADESLPA